MDEHSAMIGPAHRAIRHDLHKHPQEALRIFGPLADEACRDHILMDFKSEHGYAGYQNINEGSAWRGMIPWEAAVIFGGIISYILTYIFMVTYDFISSPQLSIASVLIGWIIFAPIMAIIPFPFIAIILYWRFKRPKEPTLPYHLHQVKVEEAREICPNCLSLVRSQDAYCENCGLKLGEDVTSDEDEHEEKQDDLDDAMMGSGVP